MEYRIYAKAAALAVVLGLLVVFGGNMYLRHNAQHWQAEQFLREQQAFNQQLIAAINQLSAKVNASAP